MNVNNISKGTKEFIFSSLDNLANNDFKSSLIRPFVKTAIENNFYKVEKYANIKYWVKRLNEIKEILVKNHAEGFVIINSHEVYFSKNQINA